MPDIWLLLATLPVIAVIILIMVRNSRYGADRQQDTRHQGEPPGNATPLAGKGSKLHAYSPRQVEEANYLEGEDDSVGGDFYAEVAELLLQVLNDSPDRQDIRMKLIDVYFDSGDKDNFVEQALAYRAHMGETGDPNWNKILGMGKHIAPEHQLFGGSPAAASESSAQPAMEEPANSGGVRIKRFGDLPEARTALEKLAADYRQLRSSPKYPSRLDLELIRTAGRPERLHAAPGFSEKVGGAQIFIKREDTLDSHPRLRIHLMGQAWIARNLGKKKIVYAATEGEEAIVATQAAARAGLECEIMIVHGQSKIWDSHRFQIEIMGARITELSAEKATADIRQHALTAWLDSPDDSFMMLNLAAGPHPYPTIASDLQGVIGRECLRQIKGKLGKPPKAIFARGGNTADAIGFVEAFLAHKETEICLVTPQDSNRLNQNNQDEDNDIYHLLYNSKQKQSASLILEDMEFPKVAREHAMLEATGRINYHETKTSDAKYWLEQMARREGLIFPLQSAHVLACASMYARHLSNDEAVVIMLAERLDKDLLGMASS